MRGFPVSANKKRRYSAEFYEMESFRTACSYILRKYSCSFSRPSLSIWFISACNDAAVCSKLVSSGEVQDGSESDRE